MWFWLGVGATAAASGVTLWSGVDTSNKHQSFADDRCAQVGSSACTTLAADGSSAQTRTNVLLGVTGALGVATVVVLLFTHWGPSGASEDGRARVGLAPGGAGGVFEF